MQRGHSFMQQHPAHTTGAQSQPYTTTHYHTATHYHNLHHCRDRRVKQAPDHTTERHTIIYNFGTIMHQRTPAVVNTRTATARIHQRTRHCNAGHTSCRGALALRRSYLCPSSHRTARTNPDRASGARPGPGAGERRSAGEAAPMHGARRACP